MGPSKKQPFHMETTRPTAYPSLLVMAPQGEPVCFQVLWARLEVGGLDRFSGSRGRRRQTEAGTRVQLRCGIGGLREGNPGALDGFGLCAGKTCVGPVGRDHDGSQASHLPESPTRRKTHDHRQEYTARVKR